MNLQTYLNTNNIDYIENENGKLFIEGDLYLHDTEISTLPEELSVKGDLDVSDTKIINLPTGLSIGGDLNLADTEITALPKGLSVGGDLDLSATRINSLSDNLFVGGDLNLSDNYEISSLPKGLSVCGDLNIGDTNVKKLPKNLSVGGGLNLYGSEVCSLPEGLCVGGDLKLNKTEIYSLPKGLSVGGNLDLSDTKVNSLSEGLSIGGHLNLSNTEICALPEDLSIGGDLDLRDTKIDTLPRRFSVGGNLYQNNEETSFLLTNVKTILAEHDIKIKDFSQQDFLVIDPKDLYDDHFIWEDTLPVIVTGNLEVKGTFFSKSEIANPCRGTFEEENEAPKTTYDACPSLKKLIDKHWQETDKDRDKSKKIFIVLGDLKCENAIFSNHPDLFFVAGKIEVKNITLNALNSNAHAKTFALKGSTTKYLLHSTGNSLDLETNFSYEAEFSHKSKSLIDKSIVIPEEYLYTKYLFQFYFYDKVFEKLLSNLPLLNEEITATDHKKKSAQKFTHKINNHDIHKQISGLEATYLKLKFESDEGVFDKRKGRGFWGIEHETQIFYSVDTNNKHPLKKDFKPSSGVDVLSTENLYLRYSWICREFFDDFFGNYVDCTAKYIDGEMTFINCRKTIDTSWTKEKDFIHKDIYLSFYWLIHFGILFDKRILDVKAIIEDMVEEEKSKVPLVKNALDFFEDDGFSKPVEIDNRSKNEKKKQKFKDIFLKRRSHLTSWYYRDSDHFEDWQIPFLIYPQLDEKYLEKIYFFKKNIEKQNAWADWEKFSKNHPNLPLASYINAFMESVHDKANLIQQALEEIQRIEQEYPLPSYEKNYAQEIIDELRALEK